MFTFFCVSWNTQYFLCYTSCHSFIFHLRSEDCMWAPHTNPISPFILHSSVNINSLLFADKLCLHSVFLPYFTSIHYSLSPFWLHKKQCFFSSFQRKLSVPQKYPGVMGSVTYSITAVNGGERGRCHCTCLHVSFGSLKGDADWGETHTSSAITPVTDCCLSAFCSWWSATHITASHIFILSHS